MDRVILVTATSFYWDVVDLETRNIMCNKKPIVLAHDQLSLTCVCVCLCVKYLSEIDLSITVPKTTSPGPVVSL